MNWAALAFRNAGRRRVRTAVSIAGVAVAVASLFSLLSFQRGYQRGIVSELDRLGAHVLVAPKGCPYDAASLALHGAKWPCYLKSAYLGEIKAQDTVATAAPAFMSAVFDPSGEQFVYCGVTPEMQALKRGWRVDGRFPQAPGELLIGSSVAEKRGWKVGASVDLPGVKGERGAVAGVLSPVGGAEDTFIHMRLADAQRVFKHPGELTHILVRLHDPNQLERAVEQMRGCGAGGEMNVVSLSHLFTTIQNLVNSTRVLLGSVALIALLIAGAGVANTMLTAVVERTREIGIMRALGASRADVFRLFWLEALLVCVAGGLLGVGVAFLASQGIEGWLRGQIAFAPTDPLIQWDWRTAAGCVGAGAVLGTLAGLLPSWRASCLPPVEAMRMRGAGT